MDIQTARGIAARIWGDPDYEHVTMNPDLADRIARMLKEEADTQAKYGVPGAGLFEEVKEVA